jgi:beta-glucanase (GH16 family)
MKNKLSVFTGGAAAIAMITFVSAAGAQEWGKPVWCDEFDSSVRGAPPDPANWAFDVGGTGWGNQELEIYCAASATTGASTPSACDSEHPNAFQDGQGHLVIRASRVSSEPAPAGTWTSARLKTRGLKEFQYGRMEACIKLPVGTGLWPAFWMLGTAGEWPAGGEIDIMENIPATAGSAEGLGPTNVESTIHGPSTAQKGLFSLSQVLTLPDGHRIDDASPACHVYGAIWSPFMIQMYVDDWRKPFFIRTAADVPKEGRWVFNAPFYFLLNLAVGGDWPGPPDTTTPSPADMVVGYVRVYKAARTDAPKMIATPMKMQQGADGGTVLRLSSTKSSGSVYLACAVEGVTGGDCSVDTGNALNASVMDFSAADSQTAKVTASSSVPTDVRVKVTAHTVSGAESSILIPVE